MIFYHQPARRLIGPATFSIVIPVYNNAPGLETLYARVASALNDFGADYEIIFVDDASRDKSIDILNDLRKTHPAIAVVELGKNQGQWEATLLGIAVAKGTYIITMDADLQYNPADLSDMYQYLLKENLVLVYGIPFRMLHGVGRIRNTLQNLILNKSWTSSFKIFHRNLVFDNKNNFLLRRHFECHEKFYLERSQKGWMEVNTSGSQHGGFRRHIFRNTNIMLSHLPEYHPRFRHPFFVAGIGLILFSFLLLVIRYAVDGDGIMMAISILLFMAGIITCTAGKVWQRRYEEIADRRRRNLAAILK